MKNITVQPALFEDTTIRRRMHKDEWHFALADVVAALTGSPDPAGYLRKLRHRDPEYSKGAFQNGTPLSFDTAGGKQKLVCAPAEGVFRLIQSIKSPKAEPFKQWFAKVAVERLQEEANPDLTLDRAIRRYKAMGMDNERLKARIESVLKRTELTDTWKKHGVSDKKHYMILTSTGYRRLFRLTGTQICTTLGVKNNPRNHMPTMAVQAMTFHEALVRTVTEQKQASGFHQCLEVVQAAGDVTRRMVEDMERLLGQPLISPPRQGNLLP